MSSAFIGLGSNVGDRDENLRAAVEMLRETDGVTVTAVSSIYETKPVGNEDQADFLNAVVRAETSLDPHELLGVTKSIEDRRQRKRTVHWGPRTLDLDILLYDTLEMDEPHLRLPHPEVSKRAFVLVPLAEVAPDQQLPDGKTVSGLLADLGTTDGVKVFQHRTDRVNHVK